MIPRQTYEQLYGKLQTLAQWLDVNGIGIRSKKRFKQTLEIVEKCVFFYKKKILKSLIVKYPPHITQIALVNAVEFCDIFQSCHDLEMTPYLKQKIRKAIGGPYLETAEQATDGSNEFRNFLFEFRLASRLREAGLDAIPSDDIELTINSTPYNIQCKRPFTEKGINQCFYDAQKQIVRMREKNKKIRGIPAICINKTCNIDGKYLRAKNELSIIRASENRLGLVLEKYGCLWEQNLDASVAAVILVISYLAIVESSNLLTTVFYTHLWSPSNTTDAKNRHTRNIEHLARALGQAAALSHDPIPD